ncbi:MAG: ankyrin repeat domain-containing protein [Planctomycetota bacterium]|jgi:cytohesin
MIGKRRLSRTSVRTLCLISLIPGALQTAGCTSIHAAARAGQYGKVEKWLALGLSPNNDWNMPSGNTPLHEAAAYGHVKIVRLLLAEGADVNKHNEGGETPLHYAARHGHVKVMAILLDHGADPTKKGTGCGTAMQWAGRGGQIRAIKVLMSYGVSVNQRGTHDGTALHEAVKHDHPDAVRFLLENGAEVDARLDYGDTPLYLASTGKGNIEIGRILLEHGADPAVECRGRPVSKEFLKLIRQPASDAQRQD